MPRIDVADDLASWLGAAPEMAGGMGALSEAVYDRSDLPLRVREAARGRIAEANQCGVCLRTRDAGGPAEGIDEAFYEHLTTWREWDGYSPRERLAIEFAERFALDHHGLRDDDDFWARFRALYSDHEVVELGISCALWVGGGRLMRVLDVAQSCSLVLHETQPA